MFFKKYLKALRLGNIDSISVGNKTFYQKYIKTKSPHFDIAKQNATIFNLHGTIKSLKFANFGRT